MQLTWLGTAGFRVKTDEGAIFLIDPFLSRPPEATPPSPIQTADLFPVDEIFLTHGCFDHAMDTPTLVEQTGAIVHGPILLCEKLGRLGVSENSLQAATLNKTKKIGSLQWQALPGQFHQVRPTPIPKVLRDNRQAFDRLEQLEQQWPLGEVLAYLFKTERFSVLHLGSAGWTEADIAGLRPDVALLPDRKPTFSGSGRHAAHLPATAPVGCSASLGQLLSAYNQPDRSKRIARYNPKSRAQNPSIPTYYRG